MTWQEQAACLTLDPVLFDPPRGANLTTRERVRVARARRHCAGCPVAAECLADGRQQHDSGVRGGHLLVLGAISRVPHSIEAPPEPPRMPSRRRRQPFVPAECGTRSGFQKHLREGVQPCAECADSEREYQRLRAQRRRHAVRFAKAVA